MAVSISPVNRERSVCPMGKNAYIGKIKNSGNQTVVAPLKTKPAKAGKVKEGKDLRTKTGK